MKIPSFAGEKKLKHPPVSSLDCKWSSLLGCTLEVQTLHCVLKWERDEAPLLWVPSKKCLVWIENPKEVDPDPELENEASRAAFDYVRWSDRSVDCTTAYQIEIEGQSWSSFGRVDRIDYWSDKKYESAEYTHATGKGVMLYRCETKSSVLWLAKGGQLRITSAGILG